MPAESTVFMCVCLCECVRAFAFASTRVCGMWFRFIAFVYSTHYQTCAVFFWFYFSFIFHELNSIKYEVRNKNKKKERREKHRPKWMRTEHKKMTSSFFLYFIRLWMLSYMHKCLSYACVIKWAHGAFFRAFSCVCVRFLFYSGYSFL